MSDATADRRDAATPDAAERAPTTDPCNRATWTFTASIPCSNCADAAATAKNLANAIDGDASTRYTTGVNQGSRGRETVTLTFRSSVTITGVNLTSSPGDGPSGYQVDHSLDGAVFGSFEPPLAAGGSDNFTVRFPAPTTMRALRITQTGTKAANWWSILELVPLACASP